MSCDVQKQCSQCHEFKPLSCFYKEKRARDGHRSECKACSHRSNRDYRRRPEINVLIRKQRNTPEEKQKNRERNAKYYAKNSEKLKEYQKRPDVRAKKNAARTTPECFAKTKEYERARREAGYYKKPEIADKIKQYFDKPEVIEKRNARRTLRRRNDPVWRLRMNISTSIAQSLKKNKSGKSNCTWEKLVGYTLVDLKRHLEHRFLPRMTWANYGKWHVDHIYPMSKFEFTSANDPAFKRCWALENLQPLWAEDNKKKSDRILPHLKLAKEMLFQ